MFAIKFLMIPLAIAGGILSRILGEWIFGGDGYGIMLGAVLFLFVFVIFGVNISAFIKSLKELLIEVEEAVDESYLINKKFLIQKAKTPMHKIVFSKGYMGHGDLSNHY